MSAKLLELLFGGGGTLSAIAGGAKVVGLIAAAPLAWNWYQGHGTDVVLTLNVGQALFVVGLVVALVQVAHSARAP
jgi:hypothetical protein